MVCIISSNQCYEGTGINQYVTQAHWPNPSKYFLLVARSFGPPLMAPRNPVRSAKS